MCVNMRVSTYVSMSLLWAWVERKGLTLLHSPTAGPRSKSAPRLPSLFACMVESVLRAAANRTATPAQICAAVAQQPEYAGLYAQLLPQHFEMKAGEKTRRR